MTAISLIDVGFGCGDQDVYMAQLYQPAQITGITIEPIQHHAAQELVQRTSTPGTNIQLYVADASKLPEFLESTPSVFNATTGHHFTHVISIDSAYHYNTRAEFLKNAAMVLAPGTGRLAMADMILAKPAPTSGLGRKIFEMVFSAMEVPAVNMKMMDEYKQDLIDAGFVDIEIECIEERVFSGLAEYIESQTGRLGGLVKPGVNWTYWTLCKGLWWLDRSKWLHFVIVKARNGRLE
ncbi:S-adenosyl-L-methionine-dependent methyltransferase [Dissophora ornata]|nr:S-adenosyl-L-methionine-dependent methyltransferase [Dissophora ornata]